MPEEAKPTVLADLGYGVLDAAMVETAAYCLSKEAASWGKVWHEAESTTTS